MKIELDMELEQEKVHSIRYKELTPGSGVKTLYVDKSALRRPYPQQLHITIEAED